MGTLFTQNHIAPTLYDKHGRPYCEAPLTSKRDTKRYVCIVPPEKVIPVIFVPGIMGSNLRMTSRINFGWLADKGLDGHAWLPDSKGFLGGYALLDASKRRRLLSPANTEVAASASIAGSGMAPFKLAPKEARDNWMAEFKRRGWGTVMLTSYGDVLCHLEYYLNRIYYRGEINPYWHNQIQERLSIDHTGVRKEADWGLMQGFKALTDDQLKHASNYWYPVHAVGYNWLKSNKEGGVYLARKIDEIIGHYKTRLGYKCEKVILATHSMGGLVARAACHPQMGNKADKVLGIVHGVMPADGAGAAYKRQHAGFEGAESVVLGVTGLEVAAVFSNSPGALQLLPNKRYGNGWLKVTDARNQELLALPKADPYGEIYREPKKWWRLMNPEWLDPESGKEPSQEKLKQTWRKYLDNLGVAEKFHDALGDYYHPRSHVHYGADEKQAAWGKVIWKETGDWTEKLKASVIRDGVITSSDALGRVMVTAADQALQTYESWDNRGRIQRATIAWRGELARAGDPGDGTVPASSGGAPASKAVFCSAMKGFDHQGSYKNPAVQELTLHCIAQIAQEAM